MTNTTKAITANVFEHPGKLGAIKASQLARLIEAYIAKHPEIDEAIMTKDIDIDDARRGADNG